MNVSYNGKEYPVRVVDIDGYGKVRISVESLQDVLIGDDGIPVSEEAERVDQGIFFYVQDSMIDMTDEDLERFIRSCI